MFDDATDVVVILYTMYPKRGVWAVCVQRAAP